MTIDRFHFDRKLSFLQKLIEKKGLTLSQLKSIEDQVLLLHSKENEEIFEQILHRVDQKRDLLLKEELKIQSPDNISKILKARMLCEDIDADEWEARILSIKDQLKNQKRAVKQMEHLEFSLQEPLAHEFDSESIGSTFSSRMTCISKMIRQNNSVKPYKNNLNSTQQRAIVQISGNDPSPEVLSQAVDAYVNRLKKQMKVAETFYFGRVKKGLEGLSRLSDDVRKRIEELVWQSSEGKSVTNSDFVAAILHSVEEQMGMHEDVA